jgi:hypothetical protein
VALVVVAAFLLITAYGLCDTYGDMVLSRIGERASDDIGARLEAVPSRIRPNLTRPA